MAVFSKSSVKKSLSLIKEDPIKIILPVFITAAFIALIAYAITFYKAGISNDTSHWGTFGDYIGGVLGTIFSFTSVLLIYFTFKKQQETSVLQQFESTFFELLNIQRDMMKSVKGSYEKPMPGEPNQSISGGDFFQEQYERLYQDLLFFPETGSKNEVKVVICQYYSDHFETAAPTLGPYYRHLYHFLKYTDESDIGGKQKKYIDIIQSQMSDAELYCLFYNSICYGSENMLPKLEKYGFLRNIESKSNSFDVHKELFYPKTLFKYNSKEVPLSEL